MKEKWLAIVGWVLDRLGEPSTWRGIVAVLTAAGVTLDPDQAAKIIAAGLSVIGAINIFRKEAK